ncbi:hypothetical protein HDV00_007870 [Rhizophlyctis rosea]|nr:hypothetical protein HDV00_007870 [Rhizophlyctis rosea]
MDMLQNAPNLETLYLEACPNPQPNIAAPIQDITAAGFVHAASHLCNLLALSVVGLAGLGPNTITGPALRTVLIRNPNLRALNLAWAPANGLQIDDMFLLTIAPHLTNLKTFELYMQNSFTEQAFAQILPFLGSLTSLGLTGCSQLTDYTLSLLPVHCPRLERLDMVGVRCTTWGVQRLVDSCGSLREVVKPEVEGVRWGRVSCLADPWSEEVVSPYGVWEREVRRVAREAGIVY